MALNAPPLDNRNFEQILRDLHLRVPLYNREWTDFNDSDPGETLLQLFAWLAETLLFEMNQVPDRNYVKFLELLGLELRPAHPATAHLAFTVTPSPGQIAGPVREGAKVSGQPPSGEDPQVFETVRTLDLIQAELGDLWVIDRGGQQDVKAANDTDQSVFRPFGWSPVPGNALYLGFVPVEGVTGVFPKQMAFRAFLPAEALAGKPLNANDVIRRAVPPVKLVWEYRARNSSPLWQRLNVFEDESTAFTREGYIVLEGPQRIEPTLEPMNAEPRYWIRVRIPDGAGSYPPGSAPALEFLLPNCVEARHLSTVKEEDLGVSDGTPQQSFETARKPVFVAQGQDPLSLVTEDENGVQLRWERAADFLDAGRESRVYLLDPITGAVRFGDGIRGMIPPVNARIVAGKYRYGGGPQGNLPAGTIQTPLTNLPGVSAVSNPRAASGGETQQSLEDLKARAPRILRQRSRAVTADDFAEIAKQLSEVKSAVAIPRMHPGFPGADVPGAITVVVVPDSADLKAVPSGDLLDSVCRLLNQHRLLTTEVVVKGPEYQGVRVEAQVEARPNASFDQVTQAVIERLNAFLNPRNRSFGEDLIPTRLLNEILGHPDVASVLTMSVYVDGRPIDLTERIAVPKDGLLYPQAHTVSVVPQEDF